MPEARRKTEDGRLRSAPYILPSSVINPPSNFGTMKAMNAAHSTRHGFAVTYILLAVAGAIMLFSFGLVIFNPPARLAETLDTKRQTDLASIQHALEDYAANHGGFYPVTTPISNAYQDLDNHQPQCYQCGYKDYQQSVTTDVPYTKDNWIPDLVDQGYIATLPIDPQSGSHTAGLCGNTDWPRGYIYISNGQNYKLIDFCGPTTGLNTTVPQDSPYCVGENKQVLQANPANQPALLPMVDPKQPGFHYAIYSPAWACK